MVIRPITLSDLLLALQVSVIREEDTKWGEQLVGQWSKLGCFGVVALWRGWPVGFVIAHRKEGQRHQLNLLQWCELPELGHTNLLYVLMNLFLKNVPDYTKSVVMVVSDGGENLGLHQNLKQFDFRCVKVLRKNFKNGDDGYLFLKRLTEDQGEGTIGG